MVIKKDRILTSSFRKIKNTYRRFISLLCMALLGVGFYAGIQATSPDMLQTLDRYLDKQNMYDIEIVSTLGLTDENINQIKQLENVSIVEGIHSKDVIIKAEKEEYVIKMIGINDNINKISLLEGNLPKQDNEIVVEKRFLEEMNLHIGDIIEQEDDELLHKEYKIVGIVESPLYFSINRGTTTLGKGQIDYYVYGQNAIFNQDYYTSIYLTVSGAKELTTSEEKYQNLIENVKTSINNIKREIEDTRYEEVYREYIQLLEMQNMSIDEANLTNSRLYITDRSNNQAYSDFIDATHGIEKIGNVFPLVFYIIAILVSLISMTRMVEEDRQELGTLKALGFSNSKIIIKYIIYSLCATILGGVIGMTIGFKLLPTIIWTIYQMLFTVPNFVAEFNWSFGAIGLLIGVLCICGSAIFTAYKTLVAMPSVLMRPKAPKVGKRILLEHIHFIWNKLNFSNKITTRNLFRYKTRVLVTIIGISGCTALILAGFSLRDSISDIVNYQFKNVSKYDKLITLKTDEEYTSLLETLQNNEHITSQVTIRMETVNIYNKDKEYEINLMVVDDLEQFNKVISLNDVDKKYQKIDLEENKVILSEKLAKLLEVEPENTVIFKDEHDKEYKIEVQAKAENYIKNYTYITKNTYEKIFGEYKNNVILIAIDGMTGEQEESLSRDILSNPATASLLSTKDTIDTVNDMMVSLNSVVVILVIASAILAFVVLYNLSNINISERQREIATLKVLGFYDKEVDNYITKENIILTIIGISLGLVAGIYLGHFIITTCETETLMFVRHVAPLSYVYSTLITIGFTIIVNVITHFNLKKIDMIESLKSIE
ncbi:MAG: ABC transporter permease [Clostridia bacterium]|nr:ABC transporter permease [Clostridia bacterium]